jgi:hypothetical protein
MFMFFGIFLKIGVEEMLILFCQADHLHIITKRFSEINFPIITPSLSLLLLGKEYL